FQGTAFTSVVVTCLARWGKPHRHLVKTMGLLCIMGPSLNETGAQMAGKTLFDKIWDSHVVRAEPDGTTLLYIDRQLVHEVTSPQAFEGLKLAGRRPRRAGTTLAVPDHNVPTTDRRLGIADPVSAIQIQTLEDNCRDFGITLFNMSDIRQGIVHVIGPEQGFTRPGTTIVCGDSHTSTHGAFGALA